MTTDEDKAKRKELKRAYKKAKRKTALPWKIAAIILAVVTLIAAPVNMLLIRGGKRSGAESKEEHV